MSFVGFPLVPESLVPADDLRNSVRTVPKWLRAFFLLHDKKVAVERMCPFLEEAFQAYMQLSTDTVLAWRAFN